MNELFNLLHFALCNFLTLYYNFSIWILKVSKFEIYLLLFFGISKAGSPDGVQTVQVFTYERYVIFNLLSLQTFVVRVGACFYLIKKGEFFSGKFDFVQVINTSGWQLRPKLCWVSLLRVADAISREWDRGPAWNPIWTLKSKRQPKKKRT